MFWFISMSPNHYCPNIFSLFFDLTKTLWICLKDTQTKISVGHIMIKFTFWNVNSVCQVADQTVLVLSLLTARISRVYSFDIYLIPLRQQTCLILFPIVQQQIRPSYASFSNPAFIFEAFVLQSFLQHDKLSVSYALYVL